MVIIDFAFIFWIGQLTQVKENLLQKMQKAYSPQSDSI